MIDPKRRKKIILFSALGVLSLLVAAQVVTSSFFLTKIVLPTVRNTTNLELYIEEIEWRPLNSYLRLKGVRLGGNRDTFLKIQDISGVYDLRENLQGIISFYSVEGKGIELNFHRNSDSVWNFKQLKKGTSTAKKRKKVKLRYNLRNMNAKNSTLSLNFGEEHYVWSRINLIGDRFQNGALSTIKSQGHIDIARGDNFDLSGDTRLYSKVNWDNNIKPQELDLEIKLVNPYSKNAKVNGTNITIEGHCQAGYRDKVFALHKLELLSHKGEESYADIEATGTWKLSPFNLALELKKLKLSHDPIALFSTLLFDITPGEVKAEGRGHVSFSKNSFATQGSLDIKRSAGSAIIDGESYELPAFSLNIEPDIFMQKKPFELKMNKLNINLKESGDSELIGKLRKQANYKMDSNSFEGTLPQLEFKLSKFDLKLLRFIRPINRHLIFESGVIDGQLLLDSAAKLGELSWQGGLQCSNLILNSKPWELELNFAGKNSLSSLDIEKLDAKVGYDRRDLGVLKATGNYKFLAQEARAKVTVREFTPNLAELKISDFFKQWSGSVDSELEFKDKSLKFSNNWLKIEDKDKRYIIESKVDEQIFNFGTNRLKNSWKSSFSADFFDVKICPEILVPKLHLKSKAEFSKDFKTLKSANKMTLEESTLLVKGIGAEPFNLDSSFKLEWSPALEVLISDISAKMATKEMPITQISGELNIQKEAFLAKLKLQELNATLLKDYLHDLSADVYVEIDKKGDDLTVDAKVDATKVIAREGATPFALNSNIAFLKQSANQTKSFDIRLDIPKVIDLKMFATNHKYSIESSMLELDKLLDLWGQRSEKNGKTKNIGDIANFNFGNEKRELELKLNNIKLSEELIVAVAGDITFEKDTIETPKLLLVLNNSPVEFSLKVKSNEQNKLIESKGELQKSLDIAPIVHLFSPQLWIKGDLERLDWNFAIDKSDSYISKGNIAGEGRDICLKNSNFNTPLMRILMLPLETLCRFNAVIPDPSNLSRHWRTLRDNIITTSSPLSEFAFDSGKFKFIAQDDTLKIEQFEFFGPIISEAKFSGEIMLGSENPLAITSFVESSGLSLEMPITGSIKEPEYSLTNMKLGITSNNLTNVIGTLADMIPGVDLGYENERISLFYWHVIRELFKKSTEIEKEEREEQ